MLPDANEKSGALLGCYRKTVNLDLNSSDGQSDDGCGKDATKKKRRSTKRKEVAIEEYEDDPDIKRGVKIAFQFLLNRQPFPTKLEDLYRIMGICVPNLRDQTKRRVVLILLKKYLHEILGLHLLSLNRKRKKEFIISQNIILSGRGNCWLTETDHALRGFLLFLIPLFHVHGWKIPLNELLYELAQVNCSIDKTPAEICRYLTAPGCALMHKIHWHYYSGRLKDPIEYLMCLKKMAFLDFEVASGGEQSLKSISIVPSVRFHKEVDQRLFLQELLKIPDRLFDMNELSTVFDEKLLAGIDNS